MCISPSELTTSEIEYEISRLRAWLDNPHYVARVYDRRSWARRIEYLEKLLKDRADEGTI